MNMILSLLFPVLKSIGTGVSNDANFGPVIAIGLVVILVVGAALIFLIVLAVKYLMRLKNKNIKSG